MPETTAIIEVRVGPQGRVVIPASLRRAAGIRPGDSLTARLEGDRLVLERQEAIVARLRERFGVVPATVSLADELIRERREEAQRDR
jgi:AbrB family looped-hinge helix DNA binding protein